jgi:hypothetical protein
MYALYKKTRLKGHCRYEFKERASLFGCNQGYIPWLLAKQMSPSQKEPYGWHLRLEEALAKADCPDSTLIIDLKPKQQKTNLSLYEVLDVWGWSASGWTPILLHLCGLLVDADPKGVDRNDFRIRNDERDEPIYEVLYLDGSVSKGKLTGRWNAPPASPTNAALLWPDTVQYFVRCIRERTPGVLD